MEDGLRSQLHTRSSTRLEYDVQESQNIQVVGNGRLMDNGVAALGVTQCTTSWFQAVSVTCDFTCDNGDRTRLFWLLHTIISILPQ